MLQVAPNVYAAIILAFNGQAERAIAIGENLVRSSSHLDLGVAVYAYAQAQGGRTEEARAILERLQWLSRERFVLSSFTTAVNVALGDTEAAIADLKEPQMCVVRGSSKCLPTRALNHFVRP